MCFNYPKYIYNVLKYFCLFFITFKNIYILLMVLEKNASQNKQYNMYKNMYIRMISEDYVISLSVSYENEAWSNGCWKFSFVIAVISWKLKQLWSKRKQWF